MALLSIFGKDQELYREDLKRCYFILEKGYNSMPINLPGTLFHKAMKARKELSQILAKIISTRRQAEQSQTHNDLLASFMGDIEGLTDDQIADNVIGVIFAARDTTASVLTWIVKYLHENPGVLEAVTVRISLNFSQTRLEIRSKVLWDLTSGVCFDFGQEEQQSILKGKEEISGEDKVLTWADTKKMPVTSRVIQETLRVASVLSFTFREAVEDVEYEGQFLSAYDFLTIFMR